MTQASPARWTHFHHVADIGVRGSGPTLASAFEQAALAMTAVITDPRGVACHERVDIRLSADDQELLLNEWLNALVYEMATRRMLFSRFQVEVDGHGLSGRAWGETVDVGRHQPAVEVKGATLTELRVWHEDGLWHAQCVVDV